MARPPRYAPAGVVQHVCNRGSRKGFLFDTARDYIAFLRLLAAARVERPMRILAYCLMWNHWHLLLWPRAEGDLSRFMHWLGTSHASSWRFDTSSQGEGAVYQSRFVGVPVCDYWHYYIAWRYVERNPVEAGLVTRAELWPWSSAAKSSEALEILPVDEPPRALPCHWLDILNGESEFAFDRDT